MHRSLTAAPAAALWLVLAVHPLSTARPGDASAVEDARQRLARDDPRGAAAALESALPGAEAGDRTALLESLRKAYAAAARKADAEGRREEADGYRDNLDILNRKPPAAQADAEPAGSPPREPAAAASEPLPNLAHVSEPPAPPATVQKASVAREQPLPGASAAASARPELVAAPQGSAGELASVEDADKAFIAKDYAGAGQRYAALDRAKALPGERRGHWAYCRAVEVVRRMNARPTAEDWKAIDGEIQAISALSPSHWFAEYLRNLASERTRSPRSRPARPRQLVVRGSSPEEPAQGAPPVATPPPAPAPHERIAWSRQPVETTNFHVVHVEKDRALAERVGQAAEAAREAQVKRWGSALVPATWSPRCEVVLFPTARDFSRETLQPADSPGFSTMGMNAGKVVLRRVHLRVDHPNVVKAVLPHEVTHVVLADLFPNQQIPRWADEGIAVLSEPPGEQALRAADLDEPLKSGRLFRINELMTMDYPDPRFWALYYAQSVSLTRFLVESGSPGQFVRFVREAQTAGFDPALRQVYAISGYEDLQDRWARYAREKTANPAAVTASSVGPDKATGPVRR